MLNRQGVAKTYAATIIAILAISTIGSVAGLMYFQSVSASPINFTDMSGRQVQINSTAKRIIVMESYWTEITCVLGAKDNIVGIGTYVKDSVFIPTDVKNLTVVGNMFSGVNLETIVSLKPDVVIMDYGYGRSSDIIASLERLGIPVVTLYGSNFNDITVATQMIAKVVGADAQAQALVSYMNSKHTPIISTSASIPDASKPTVLICNLDVWKNGLIYCYANSTWGRSVTDVGGINLALRDNPALSYIKVNMEQVLTWNPDIIVIIGRTNSSLTTQINSINNSLWSELKAVKEGKVYTLLSGAKDPNAFLDWTPRLIVGEIQLAKLLQPTTFASLDWNSTATALFAQYYNTMLGR
jgi:ABC-type Fe3+-hydroxamate transport system substrate-binding protein